ncbi:hypothetical protein GYH30_004638 [Glycine max]|nr:hypothetical protein GYH30_004638 [Glycine max]
MHSVAWSKFCKPKLRGGMGFRYLRLFNKSLIMKLGWGLISSPNSLGVKVFRDNYGRNQGFILDVKKTSNCYDVWKGIQGVWNNVLKGGWWILRNGRTILFWKHHWLKSGMVLLLTCPSPPPLSMLNFTANIMVDNSGNWKMKHGYGRFFGKVWLLIFIDGRETWCILLSIPCVLIIQNLNFIF